MLKEIDNLIVRVLDTGWTTTPPPAKPGFFFTVPDEAWLTKVKAESGMRLNIYLYELRENRDFRRSAWDNVTLSDGSVALSQPPAYIDIHYLVSAWSPAEDTELASPTLDEHQVLAEAMRVLFRNPDVVPGAIGVAGGGVVFQNSHVYLTVAPPEPSPVLNEFWSTMKLPWRPAVMLIVTAPLDVLKDSASSPVVTTLIQRFVLEGSASVEELIDFGGLVLKAADQSPIHGASVSRVNSTDTATTDAQGRFVFTGIRRGVHKIRASATGMTPVERDINIPVDPPASYIFKLAP